MGIDGSVSVYSNERSRAYRVQGAHEVFVCKKLLGADAVARARRERDILARLAGVTGVPQLAPIEHAADVIALRDERGAPLSVLLQQQPLTVAAIVALGCQLARIVGEVHARGVIHRDINPANIVLAGPDSTVLLINFHLASTATELAGAREQGQLFGTLAYLAPEQADGGARAIDHRADLYALGVTLYTLTVGQPPFTHADPVQQVHAQLTRTAPAPATLGPVPVLLSDLIMRLLEKEPERRYQSAQGLAHDLTQLAALFARDDGADAAHDFVLGLRDFPMRIPAPRHLVGRTRERDALLAAFEQVANGAAGVVLLSGAVGVGKGRLVAQLRDTVAAHGGLFVTGKFDRKRQDRQSDGFFLALEELGRLLLAQDDDTLASIRTDMRAALGVNLALAAKVSREFAILLGMTVDAEGASAESPMRMLTAASDLLRAVVSPQRPLVIAIDELQWAHPLSVRLLQSLVTADPLPGLLLVLAWRDDELAPGHPLAQLLPQWEQLGATRIALNNLALPEVALLLEQMLRLPGPRAYALAAELARHTGGNPHDTVALVNALRQAGVLRATDDGWDWDPALVRRHVGSGSVFDLLLARVGSLPPETRDLLDVMACLGGALPAGVLEAATGLSAKSANARLAPAIDDGLVAADGVQGALVVRFWHERVREVIYEAMDAATLSQLHLSIARRLDQLPDALGLTAAQYLPVADTLEGAERSRAVTLFREAARLVRLSNDAACERLLDAALQLLGVAHDDAARTLQTKLRCERHAALVNLGRNDEADALYHEIDAEHADPLVLVDAAALQIARLMLRSRPADAMALGMHMLARLGLTLPRFATDDEVAFELEQFSAWLEQVRVRPPASHPELTDARLRALAMVLERCAPAAFLLDARQLARIALAGWRLCAQHGMCAPLIGPLSHVGMVSIRQRSDYRLGYVTGRFLLALCEARGYVLEGARVRAMFVVTYAHWFDPVEQSLPHGRQAHETLMQGGDWLTACLPLMACVSATFESAPALADAAAQSSAALAVAARVGNVVAAPYLRHVLALTQQLQSEETIPATDDLSAYPPIALSSWHLRQALQGALMDDLDLLDAQSAAADALKNTLYGVYNGLIVTLLRGLALARRAQAAAAPQRAVLLASAAPYRAELARRAADAPANFAHLLAWLDAELAWAEGAYRQAAQAFDDALDALQARQRPWHRALTTERAGLFQLAHGMRQAGRRLIADAHGHYHGWGATAKLRQLERNHPFLQGGQPDLAQQLERHGSVSTGSLHMMAVLRASQALSSETSLARLQVRVEEQLGAMTGAGKVLMMLPGEHGGWALAGMTAPGAAPVSVEQAAAIGLLPLSAFRYLERTRSALVVDDLLRDGRFADDPYCAQLQQCSLLMLPILNQGVLRAILMLENTQRRGAFAADRLEAVQLVAGQLAVSLDNAMLYASLERKVAERTQALELANSELAALSLTDALTGLANRRRFDDVLQAEWRRALRPGERIGAAMIDVDQFKLYNDHYGHQQGDACLRMVASALAASVRQGVDLVARYGGEEFAIILPGADLDDTRLVAERARAAVAALLAPHLPSLHGVVTVSIGIASLPATKVGTPEALFHAADGALYRAKQRGRNLVLGDSDP